MHPRMFWFPVLNLSRPLHRPRRHRYPRLMPVQQRSDQPLQLYLLQPSPPLKVEGTIPNLVLVAMLALHLRDFPHRIARALPLHLHPRPPALAVPAVPMKRIPCPRADLRPHKRSRWSPKGKFLYTCRGTGFSFLNNCRAF